MALGCLQLGGRRLLSCINAQHAALTRSAACAPLPQIKLLRVLAKLCTGDKVASDNAAAVVGAALKRAGGGQTISNAIVYEAVR